MILKELKQILTEYLKVNPIDKEIHRKARTYNNTDWLRVSAISKYRRSLEEHTTSDSILDYLIEDIFINKDKEACIAAAKTYRWFRDSKHFVMSEFESSLGKVFIIMD